MAGNQRSESGINWELERQLAARGYGFDDTDASALAAEYLDVEERFDVFQLTDDTAEETRNESSEMRNFSQVTKSVQPGGLKGIYRGRGMNRQNRDLSLAELAERDYSMGDTDRPRPGQPNLGKSGYGSQSVQGHGSGTPHSLLPGTSSTRVWPETQPVFMNRTPIRPSKSRDTVEDAGSFHDTRRSFPGAHQRRVVTPNKTELATPQHFTWQDTEEYQEARKNHGESAASKMFPPKPPSNIKREEIVRPNVWKSPPVAPMTDHRCREPSRLPSVLSSTPRGVAAVRMDSVTVEEKRKLSSRSLPPEPPAGDEDVITIAIKLPSGKRVSRRFFTSDSLTSLKNFVWSQQDAPNSFEVYSNCPRRILECSPSHSKPFVDTFENAGITKNEILHVEAVK
ncbi:unnamed protein product [Allacma fusca]|uniref:UBX domain-containing protein n=1 Tax=Allacma fusca TaxID=39272 RepID=A0A8J2PEY7_9HEXA|nr:unnamed protein product [Allacma fusca]